MTRRRQRRPGFTLIEMVVVVAVLVIIGGVILPTLAGMTGNTKVKASADSVKARLLEARLAAMEQGRPYVFSISPDGTQVRVAPDETVDAPQAPDGGTVPDIRITETLPDDITVAKQNNASNDMNSQTADGFTPVATFQPDGTCKEDSPDIEVQEGKVAGVVIRVRGLTGAVTVTKPTAQQQQSGGMK